MLTTDWQRQFGLTADLIKGGVCCSGLFDLKPARLSARSKYVSFTDETEQALSSQRHLHLINCPLIVAYGTLETPEFQRQSRDFAAAVQALASPSSFWSATATITSRCRRRLPTRTVCSGVPRWSR